MYRYILWYWPGIFVQTKPVWYRIIRNRQRGEREAALAAISLLPRINFNVAKIAQKVNFSKRT
jgi:hypothetical protein